MARHLMLLYARFFFHIFEKMYEEVMKGPDGLLQGYKQPDTFSNV